MKILLCMLALAALACGQASWDEQVRNSGLLQPACSVFRNLYNFQFVSALTSNARARVTLSCTAAPAVTLNLEVPASSTLADLNIAPVTPYFVANTPCMLIPEIEALNTTDPDDFLELLPFSGTCGPVPNNQFNDFIPDCSYIDWACQVQNGHALRYGLFMLPACSLVTLLCLCIGFVIMVDDESTRIARRLRKYDLTTNYNALAIVYTGDRPAPIVVIPPRVAGKASFSSSSSSAQHRRPLLKSER